MKRFLRSMTLTAVLAGLFVPLPAAEAATTPADRKKEQRFLKQLQRLQNGGAPPAKVKQRTLKLVRLSPQKSPRWYRIGTRKYAAAIVRNRAPGLARVIKRLVGRSDLLERVIRRVDSQITKIERRVTRPVPPTPPPTPQPYQAGFGGITPTVAV